MPNNYLYSVPDTSVFPLGDLGVQGRLGLLLFHPEISTPSSIFFSLLYSHNQQSPSCLGPPPRPLLAQSCSRPHFPNQLHPGPKPARGDGPAPRYRLQAPCSRL